MRAALDAAAKDTRRITPLGILLKRSRERIKKKKKAQHIAWKQYQAEKEAQRSALETYRANKQDELIALERTIEQMQWLLGQDAEEASSTGGAPDPAEFDATGESVVIERCRLDTDSPAFIRLHEIPGLAENAVPVIARAPAADASSTAASLTPTIISMGDGCYRIGNREPFKVTDKEDAILQSFIGRPALSGPDLQNRSGYDRGREVLKALQVKYGGLFAEAIKLPGGKTGGGYRVSIRAIDAQ